MHSDHEEGRSCDVDAERTQQHIRELMRHFLQVGESEQSRQHDTDEWLPAFEDEGVTDVSAASE